MNSIKTYIRNEKNEPTGVVVAIEDGKTIRFGYALCNPCDKFNKKVGTRIATNRAFDPRVNDDEALAPLLGDRRQKVLDAYNHLERRAKRYFKQYEQEA